MKIALTREHEKMIKGNVAAGRYSTAGELVCEALRLWQDREIVREARLEELRKAIQEAEKQFERGEYIEVRAEKELDELFQGVIARGRARAKAAKKRKGS